MIVFGTLDGTNLKILSVITPPVKDIHSWIPHQQYCNKTSKAQNRCNFGANSTTEQLLQKNGKHFDRKEEKV